MLRSTRNRMALTLTITTLALALPCRSRAQERFREVGRLIAGGGAIVVRASGSGFVELLMASGLAAAGIRVDPDSLDWWRDSVTVIAKLQAPRERGLEVQYDGPEVRGINHFTSHESGRLGFFRVAGGTSPGMIVSVREIGGYPRAHLTVTSPQLATLTRLLEQAARVTRDMTPAPVRTRAPAHNEGMSRVSAPLEIASTVPPNEPAAGGIVVRTDGVDFPFPGYLENVVRQLALRFLPPDKSTARPEVMFLVHRDGSVSDVRFLVRSGSMAFDLEAEGAVEQAAQVKAFGPLPAGFADDVLPVVATLGHGERAEGPTYFEFQVDVPARADPSNPTVPYPEVLRRNRVEGDVLAQFVVDTSGRAEIASFKVLKSTDELFSEALLRALPSLRFIAAEKDGRKVRQVVQMPYSWTLPR